MSWQSYVDDQLVGTGQVSSACIIGAVDGGLWASSKGFSLKGGEGSKIAGQYKNPSCVFAEGITVNGVKYMGIKADDRSIYGKKGATGVALAKTNQCILIGYYDERQQPGNAALTVEKLADYLLDNGY